MREFKLFRTLFVFLLCSTFTLVYGQQKTVTGKVTDSDGEPITGVNVYIDGTTIGVTTDKNGSYQLIVDNPENAVLVFSFLGFSEQKIPIGNQTSVNVKLEEESIGLVEVVAIGYGTVRKRDLTGAVTSIKSSEIREVPAQSPLQSIQGKIAGVDIGKSNGSATSSTKIEIRGQRSIGAKSDPLYIVDGMQVTNIDNINPNDIASIEILKDASSTAIYGWQGANGIVMVTTKKGVAGKLKVDFNSYYGISAVSRYPSVMTGPEYTAIKREANRTAGNWNSVADDASIFSAQELEAIANNEWIDYHKELLHNGTQQDYQLGVSGGTDKTKSYTSIDYYKEKGILKFDELKRYSLRANIDHTFNSWILAGIHSQITHRDESYRRDPLNMANKIIPLGTIYDDEGNFILNPVGGNTVSPLADEQPDVFNNEGRFTVVNASTFLELKPIKGLSVRTNFGVNIENSRTGLYEGQNSISRATATGSFASYKASNNRFVNWDNVVTYKKDINDHSFTITALSSYVESIYDNVSSQGEGQLLSSQLFYALANAPSNIVIGSGYKKWNVLSFAARLNYSYKGKYLATLTDRADGASMLSEGNKWASFPSAAVAWRIVDEDFMNNIPSISELKLRLSYGIAGNSNIDPYGTQSLLMRVPMSFDESTSPGYTFDPLVGNPDAGWELSATKNLGIDLGLFNDRLSLTVDVYDTRTTALLLKRGLPPTTGAQNTYQNVGETRNRGFEISLNSINLKTNDFSWRTVATFTTNKEEIVSLITEGIDDIGNGWFIDEPIKVFYDYEKLGIWQTSEADEAAKWGQEPGDIKVKDLNGDGSIDAVNDRKVLGANDKPNWYGGLNNKLTYKGFDLNVYLFVRWGQMLNPSFLSRYDRQSNLGNSSSIINYWTPENPSNDYPRPNANLSGSSTLYWSTLGYVDGSYLRLRNLSIGYTFPDSKYFRSLRLYATATNLFTWTKSSKLKEYDPERGGGESSPMTKSFVFGINIGL